MERIREADERLERRKRELLELEAAAPTASPRASDDAPREREPAEPYATPTPEAAPPAPEDPRLDEARDELVRALYDELHRMAASKLAKLPVGETLQATALVNEAYLRLLGDVEPEWENRRHFFFVAARAMHDIIVEAARAKATAKRGGNWQRAELTRIEVAVETPADDLLELAPVCEEAGFEGIMLADHLFAPEEYASRYPYDDSGEAPFDGETPFP